MSVLTPRKERPAPIMKDMYHQRPAIRKSLIARLWLFVLLFAGYQPVLAQCTYLLNTDFETSGQNPGG